MELTFLTIIELTGFLFGRREGLQLERILQKRHKPSVRAYQQSVQSFLRVTKTLFPGYRDTSF